MPKCGRTSKIPLYVELGGQKQGMALFRRWCDGSRRGIVVLQEVAEFEERPVARTRKSSNAGTDDHRVSCLQFVVGIEES